MTEGPIRHLFTAAEAQQWLDIPAATIRSWARRGSIWPFGLTDDGRPMYDRDDLMRLRNRRSAFDRASEAKEVRPGPA